MVQLWESSPRGQVYQVIIVVNVDEMKVLMQLPQEIQGLGHGE